MTFLAVLTMLVFCYVCYAYLHAPVVGEPVGGADLSELAGEITEKLRQVFLPFVPTLKKEGFISIKARREGLAANFGKWEMLIISSSPPAR